MLQVRLGRLGPRGGPMATAGGPQTPDQFPRYS